MTQPKTSKQVDRTVGLIRFVAVLGVFSSATLATLLFLSSAIGVFRLTLREVRRLGESESLHTLVLAAVEQADTLLIATALLIVGFGLYGLFVDAIDTLPRWLRISTVDELKSKLLGVVVVALAVQVFAQVYRAGSGESLLVVGGVTGFVILALAAYSYAHPTEHARHEDEREEH